MTIPNAIVEVFLDEETRRLRVRPVSRIFSGFVRFPKVLRIAGARYAVETLTPTRNFASWDARGRIERVA
jgi:hypothetical protein